MSNACNDNMVSIIYIIVLELFHIRSSRSSLSTDGNPCGNTEVLPMFFERTGETASK